LSGENISEDLFCAVADMSIISKHNSITLKITPLGFNIIQNFIIT